MSSIRRPLFLTLTLCVATAWGQSSSTNKPQIGYLYPGGGRQGTVVLITAGGQFLRGAADVHVSGEGVHAKVIEYIKPLRNLQKEQRQLLQQRMKEVREMRVAELSAKSSGRAVPAKRASARKSAAKPQVSKDKDAAKPQVSKDKAAAKPQVSKNKDAAKPQVSKDKDAAKPQEVTLPDHPLLYDLENKSLRELAHITNILFASRAKQQPNRQISESVLIEVAIDPDAEPGDRAVRLGTAAGLTNPVVFQVGLLPEIRELEPNNQQAYPELPNLAKVPNLPKAEPLDLPVLLNGQIMPGDVDRFRFSAQKGQQLVIEAHARGLIPYLADAVPGWFQATLALYDAGGNEVAFADDYRFSPDPVLFYEIPKDGQYELEIRDSIYRGREDFVYRIAVSEQPFITQAFPLGGKAGVETFASVSGWNLPETRLPLDTGPGVDDGIRHAAYRKGKKLSNPVSYAVDTLPECNETESNDTLEDAQRIDLPKIINGRIDRTGDLDVFRFEGRAGDKVLAEVCARRLNSPLDSLLRLTDASGKVLEWNDDYVLKDSHLYMDTLGLMTHHADSYMLAKLPEDGTYYVHLADSQSHGGAAHAYRLRIAAPQGDFSLRVTPSSLSVRAGGIIPIRVHALRKDGFNGEIEVVLKDRDTGFSLGCGRIPAGSDGARMTLTAPLTVPNRPVALNLEGRAQIGGETVSRPVVPADDVMQAFLYRHLVPTKQLLVSVQKSRSRTPPVELAGDGPVRIPAGGTARVLLKARSSSTSRRMQLELNDPPEGVTLQDVKFVPQGLAFELKADEDAVQVGFADNLIVEVFTEFTPRRRDSKQAPQKRRYSVGIFPAIPIEIVQQ
jgi:hypothetical protein